MKVYIKFFVLLILVATACDDEETKVNDPIHEFIAFKGAGTVDVNEQTNSTEAVPLVVELKAFKPYSEDIQVTLEVTGNNAQEGVDFTITPSSSVTIPAGSFVSEPILIHTINNESGTTLGRSFTVAIKSVSENINIGLGLAEPKNSAITINILDDECSDTPAVFNGDLSNTLAWGYAEGTWDETDVGLNATGSAGVGTVTISGDLIYYDGFIPGNVSLTLTLQPDIPGGTKGKATFGELDLGDATDGYHYRLLEIGEGTYDVCSGSINTYFVLQYEDGGSWADYYFVESTFEPK